VKKVEQCRKHGKKRGRNKPFVQQRVAERREGEVKEWFKLKV